MRLPVVRPFVAADAVALVAPALKPAGIGWAGLAAFPGWTITWDDRPAWAGGLVPTGPGIGEVWCQVAPAAAATAPVRLAREIRWGLRDAARRFGFATLTAHFPPDTPARAIQFAAWLGFRPEGACGFDTVGRHTTWRVGA